MENTEAMDAAEQTEQEVAPVEGVEAEAIPQAEEKLRETGEQEQAEQGLKVRFNHRDCTLTHEEAVAYAQKGLKYDTIAPMLRDLSYLAAINGKTAAELVKEYIHAGETLYRHALEDKYGEDTEVIDVMMERYRAQNNAKYEELENDRRNAEKAVEEKTRMALEERLAQDFAEMQKEFPEIKSFVELPREVKQEAVDGRDLLTAYLLYRHREEKKTAAAKQTEAAAVKASAGKMGSTDENDDPLMAAFLKGLKT